MADSSWVGSGWVLPWSRRQTSKANSRSVAESVTERIFLPDDYQAVGRMDGNSGPPDSPAVPAAFDDPAVAEALFPLLYEELRGIAHRQLSVERTGHTLSTTALVHETYFKLSDQTRARFSSRAHFLSVAALAMRRILVSHARQVYAEKRGGRRERLDLEQVEIPVDQRAESLVELDGALDRLTALNPRLSRIVECRFFGGMSEEETAAALGITARTVRRDWVKAKGWLLRDLEQS
jgi:RNA polymerase sigma factor (TIGR02999 family)